MLREQGAQRPTAFEVLAHVHKLRGTKSPFKYPLPTPTLLSPRLPESKANPLDGVITYRQPVPQPQASNVQPVSQPQPLKPTDVSTPERRTRPKSVIQLSSSTPLKPLVNQPVVGKVKLIDDSDFGADGDSAWKSATTRSASAGNFSSEEAWKVASAPESGKMSKPSVNHGFNDDFTQSLRVPMASSTNKPLLTTPSPRPQAYSPKITPLPQLTPTPNGDSRKSDFEPQIRAKKERDAFEGLGLMTPVSKPAPTLGEARKLRTGLAIVSPSVNRPIKPSNSPRLRPKVQTPRASPIPPFCSSESVISSQPSPRLPERVASSAESRFPSLEELDASFSRSDAASTTIPRKQDNKLVDHTLEPPVFPRRPGRVNSASSGSNVTLSKTSPISQNASGTRSGHITSAAAMRDSSRKSQEDLLSSGKTGGNGVHDSFTSSKMPNPMYSRQTKDVPRSYTLTATSEAKPPPSRSLINHANRSKDLLTGDDEPELPLRQVLASKFEPGSFKIRDSPSKRASVIERSNVLEATIPQQGHAPSPPIESSRVLTSKAASSPTVESPTVSRFTKSFPPIDTSIQSSSPSGLTENWSPIADAHPSSLATGDDKKDDLAQGSSSEDEGPEEAIAGSNVLSKLKAESKPKHKARQSSVHDLVDLWGGGISGAKEKQPESPVHPVSNHIKRNAGVARHKSTYVPPPRPSSPPRKPSPAVTGSSNVPNTDTQPSQGPSLPSPLPKSSRSRPQSMLIFPSISNDSPSVPSPRLLASDDLHPPPVRRTSISDMVQRFEAIQATVRVSANAAPSSPSNPVKLTHLPSRDNGDEPSGSQPVKASLDKIAVALPGLGTPSTRSGDPVKRRTSLTTPSGRPASTAQKTSPIPPAAPISRADSDRGGETFSHSRNATRESIKLPTPVWKPMLTMEDVNKQSQADQANSAQNAGVDNSAPPDRPYQGVGKLIDQWQRISAEAESPRHTTPGKRANVATSK